jgi:hypothetical protein
MEFKAIPEEAQPLAEAAFRMRSPDLDLVGRLGLGRIDEAPKRNPGEWGRRLPWLFNQVTIDEAECRYKYHWQCVDDLAPGSEPKTLVCTEEPWAWLGAPSAEPFSAITLQVLRVNAAREWKTIAEAFHRTLRSGEVMAIARRGDPAEPDWSIVPPEAWEHLEITDWGLGTAESDVGQPMFSIHIQRLEVMPPQGDPVGSVPEAKARRGWRQDKAKEIIDRRYPGGAPTSLSDAELTEEVRKEWDSSKMNPPPSQTTVKRAAGRRSYAKGGNSGKMGN